MRKLKFLKTLNKQEAEMRIKKEAVKAATSQPETQPKGTGSVWNPNSYFWEEKNLNKWSQEKIQEFLGSFVHTVPGGSLKVTQCDITGDSSASIRKGKKIIVFDYEIDLKWKIDLKWDDNEAVVTGHFKLPEVSNAVYDDEEEVVIHIEYSTGEESRDKIHDHLRGPVLDAIRKNLEKYRELTINEG